MDNAREMPAGTSQVWLLSWSGTAVVTTAGGSARNSREGQLQLPRDGGPSLAARARAGALQPFRRQRRWRGGSRPGPSASWAERATASSTMTSEDACGWIWTPASTTRAWTSTGGSIPRPRCYYIPATEPCAALVEGMLRSLRAGVLPRTRQDRGGLRGRRVRRGTGHRDPRPSRIALRPIAELRIALSAGRPGSSGRRSDDANTDANICIAGQPARAWCSSRSASARPPAIRVRRGARRRRSSPRAVAVWAKACVSIVARPMMFITNATLKTSSDLAAIRACLYRPRPRRHRGVLRREPAIGAGRGPGGRHRPGLLQAGDRRAERRQSRAAGARAGSCPEPAASGPGLELGRRVGDGAHREAP